MTAPSRPQGAGRDPGLQWAPAFAGVIGFLMRASVPWLIESFESIRTRASAKFGVIVGADSSRCRLLARYDSAKLWRRKVALPAAFDASCQSANISAWRR